MSSEQDKFSLKRLQLDYLELKKNPLGGIAVEPLEKNFYEFEK